MIINTALIFSGCKARAWSVHDESTPMGVKLYYFSKIFVDVTSDFYFAKVSEYFVDPSFIDISAVLIQNYAPS